MAGAGLLAALILAVDLSLPLGVAGGVPYVALVCLGWYCRSSRHVVALGAVASLLTVVGYLYSPDGGTAWVVLANRALALLAIWVVVAFVVIAKRTAENVQASRRRFSGLLELSPQAVISLDGDQSIQLFNKGAEDIFGYSAREVLGRPIHMLLPSRYREDHAKHLRQFAGALEISRSMGIHRTIVGLRKDGSEFSAKGSISKLDLGEETVFTVMLYDSTEEEAAQRKIVELARFPDESPSPVLRVAPDGSVLYANNAARQVAELFTSVEQTTLTENLAKDVTEAFEAGTPREIDFVAGDRTYGLTLTPVAGESYLNLYGRDITERKRAEAALREANDTLEVRVAERTGELEDANRALQGEIAERERAEAARRESEERFREFAESASDWLWELDSEFRFTLDTGGRPLSGLGAEDLIGRTRWEMPGVDADDETWRQHRADLEAHRPIRDFEFSYQCKDGETRYARISGKPLFADDGQFQGYRGTATEITERKRVAEATKENEARLGQAARIARLGYWLWDDADERYAYCSDESATLYGYTVDEYLAKFTSYDVYLDSVHPDDRALYDQEISKSIEERRTYDVEARVRTASGDYHWFREIGEPIWDEQGRRTHTMGIVQDITDHKHAEAALQESRELLQAVIDGMPAIVNVKDKTGRLLIANPAQAAFYGLTPGEMVGRTIDDIVDPDYARMTRQVDLEVMESGRPTQSFEDPGVDSEGVETTWLTTKAPIKAANGPVTSVLTVSVDITRMKRAEAEVRESRELLQAMLDSMPAIVNVKDRAGRYVMANPAQAAFYGLTPDELVGRTIDDIVDPDYASMTRQVDLEVMESDRPTQSFEDRGVDPEGLETTWLTTKAPIRAANGPVTGVLTVSVDITRLKRAEATLLQQSQSAELLRKIAASANEAPDADTAMQDCLDHICDYTWWPVGHVYELAADGTGELVPTNLWRLDDPERFDVFRRVTEASRFAAGHGLPGRVLANGKPEWIPDVSKHPDFPRARTAEDIGVVAGMAFPVLVGREVVAVLEFFSDAAAEPDGRLLEIMVQAGTQLGRAIERRRAEVALTESEAQFRDLIAGSIQGVLIHRDDKPLFANPALADIFGYDGPDEILALSSVGALKAGYERERLEAYSTARLRNGSAPERYEFEGVRKDGNPIWLENFVTVVEWNGEPAIQTTTVNITDRKQAEEALARSSEDLRTARDEAETASRAKSEFLATMSHELRTPLNAIIGFSEIIKEETFGPVGSAQYRGYASDIHGSGQHLLGLINDILDLSKVESGAEELYEEEIPIPDLVHSVLRLVRQRAEKSGIELELDLDDDLPLLRVDERKLKQILVNLLTNAVKFTDAGGKVTLKAWCRADSGFVFQVIDTGVGIAPEDIPKALSQFGQVDSKRNRTQEGTGLGLPLSKSLAELHGGSLDLQSRPGVGTTATVRIPAARIVPTGSSDVSAEADRAAS